MSSTATEEGSIVRSERLAGILTEIRDTLGRNNIEEIYNLHIAWLEGRWVEEVNEEEDHEIGRAFLAASDALEQYLEAVADGSRYYAMPPGETWQYRRWSWSSAWRVCEQDEDLCFIGCAPTDLLVYAFVPRCPKADYIVYIFDHALHDSLYAEVRKGNGIAQSAGYAQQIMDLFIAQEEKEKEKEKEQEEKEKEKEQEKEREKEKEQLQQQQEELSLEEKTRQFEENRRAELYRYAKRVVGYAQEREVTEASEVRGICFDVRRCERRESVDPQETLVDGVWTAHLVPEKLLINAKTGALSADPAFGEAPPAPPSRCVIV